MLAALASGALASGPSDCEQARHAAERLICDDTEAGGIDRVMAESYSALREATSIQARDALLREQRVWLARRNRCNGPEDALKACVVEITQARVDRLRRERRVQVDGFHAIVAGIEHAPAAAAVALAGYDHGLALAWQVYLARFWPQAGLDEAEAARLRERASARLQARDRLAASIWSDIAQERSAELADLTLLRMWIDLERLDEPAARAHCFVFRLHPRWAYRAMGPLYGSSRDGGAPLCDPEGDLFERAEWKRLEAAFDPLLRIAHAHANGTIRFASYAGWRTSALRATVSPRTFLDDPGTAGDASAPERAVAMQREGWTEAQRRAAVDALAQARAATVEWLGDAHGLAPGEAAPIAAAIVADWVKGRLEYVDDWWPQDSAEEGRPPS